MTITADQGSLLSWIKDKKKCLNIIEIIIYCLFIGCAVALILLSNSRYWLVYFEAYWVFIELGMSTVTILAMRSIH